MEIETDRIILRAPNKADHPLFIGLCMDPKVTEHFEYIKRDSEEKVLEFLMGMVKGMEGELTSLHYVIIEKDQNRSIGFIGIGDPEEEVASLPDRKVMNFGYAILPKYWGFGYATEALSLVIKKCFATFPNIELIHGECDADNIGSIKVMEKAGMKRFNQYKDKDGSVTIEFMIEQ
ncbi:GNAT family N-acetyltransferase [Candidatus Nomurabacteria bacterium]|uniref:GNAT family N-acetyltransferase n=1 Tax=Candidatus Dojkabacteria bacterium TaxID=2099670 RepID=A0A955KYH1_9BACT|nr:GNAT family N-acetyltransferase [Candidatus Dojkabacteria bacterium]MCB9789683.1 GNAT family N-acetyltransferase [Candidatus Nomurabacteria bacterium]MCB9804014.1 GNAT family N-acetyltransferase [Candidatus Nomurabacteria bacterium]